MYHQSSYYYRIMFQLYRPVSIRQVEAQEVIYAIVIWHVHTVCKGGQVMYVFIGFCMTRTVKDHSVRGTVLHSCLHCFSAKFHVMMGSYHAVQCVRLVVSLQGLFHTHAQTLDIMFLICASDGRGVSSQQPLEFVSAAAGCLLLHVLTCLQG